MAEELIPFIIIRSLQSHIKASRENQILFCFVFFI